MSLTGNWKLNLAKSTSQKELLVAMGKPSWVIRYIDQAEEDFVLFHFCKNHDGKPVHYFEKFVKIYLNSTLLQIVSALFDLEYDKVSYSHKLVANNKEKHHEDDEKRFGKCISRTTWEPMGNRQCFVIRWYLNVGLLKSTHWVNDQDELNMEMELTSGDKVTKATKVFDRVPLSEKQALLNAMPYKNDLVV